MTPEQTGKHTPGPWRTWYSEAHDVWIITNESGQMRIAETLGFDTNEADEANARLIASAPALLTRVQELEAENKNQKERIEALIDNHGLTTAKIKTIAAEKTVEELQAKLTAQAAEIETMGQNLNKANDKANAQFKVYELEIENLKKNKAINEALMLEGADKITEQAVEIEKLKKQIVDLKEELKDARRPGMWDMGLTPTE